MPKINHHLIKTVWPNALALAHAAAHLIVNESNKAVSDKGYFSIAFSGGSTPKLLFELLAQPPYRNNIPWKKTIIAFGDERFVAPNSDESNYKMAKDALLSIVPIPKKNILVVPTVKVSTEESAKQYQQMLKPHINKKNPFDLVLLGIGEEGHTASVFPNSPLIDEPKAWVKSIWVEEKQMDRISFTIPFINSARNVAFLVSGASKAAIVRLLFSKKGAALPAAKVMNNGSLYWMLDEAANGNA